MAISADINKALADQLFAIYSHAEFVMMDKVARRVNRGITEIGWNEIKLQEVTQFRQEIQSLVNDLETLGKKKLSSKIIEAYKTGKRSASTDLGRPESFMEKLFIPGSLQRLILESNNLIAQTSVQILRNVMDNYRSVQAEAVSGVLVGVDTRKQAAQRALNKFADQGITGFVDKRGRNWELASYVEMATRTVTAHAALQGHLDRQAEIGNDLVMVSSFGATCPVCAPYAGKVLSISGKDQSYSSLDSAREAGLFHPNCRHTVTAYFPFIDEGELKDHKHEIENNPEAYAMQQKQRYNERQLRRWKRRQLAAITSAEAQKATAQIKAWDSRQRELLQEYKDKFGVELKRKRERERITGRIGKAGKEGSPNWTGIQIEKQTKKPAQRGRKGPVASPEAQKVGKEGPGFKPAKTIEEATKFSEQYFDKVDLPGIKLKHLNKINEGIYKARNLFSKDFKLGWISYIPKGYWKKANAVCQVENKFISFRKSYLVNTKYEEQVKNYQLYRQRILQKYLDTINNESRPKSYRRSAQKKYDALLKIKRWSASYDFGKENSIIATSAHEYGHAIYNANQYAKDNWLNELKAAGVYDKMEDGIVSEYAMTNEKELFAEVTALCAIGQETEVPDSILTIYKKMLKEG